MSKDISLAFDQLENESGEWRVESGEWREREREREK